MPYGVLKIKWNSMGKTSQSLSHNGCLIFAFIMIMVLKSKEKIFNTCYIWSCENVMDAWTRSYRQDLLQMQLPDDNVNNEAWR